jgi:hypothetical protein
MPKIFKPASKSKYVVFYTDHNGRRKKKTLASDKRISERIAAAMHEVEPRPPAIPGHRSFKVS